MKNKHLASIALILLVLFAFSLVGCKNLTPQEGYDALQNALSNSLSGTNGDIYYAKLTTVSYDASGAKHTKITAINVLADEENYEIIVSANGEYSNLCAEISVSEAVGNTEATPVYTAKFGKLSGGGKAFVIYENGKETRREVLTDSEFYSYSEYLPFSMRSLLRDTKLLDMDDLNFDIPKADVSKKGKVITITFGVNDSYNARHQEAFGTPSPFGADYVTVEVAYDRIQSVIAYKREPGFENLPDAIAIDYETYKLEISYRGPKISPEL